MFKIKKKKPQWLKNRKIQDAVDLQNDLSSLEEWERKWQMCFHPEKCIVIRVPGKRQFHQTSYTLHGHTLDVVDSGKYLGVTINKDLTWTKRETHQPDNRESL